MFRFCCRIAGMILFALAVVLAMLDVTRLITASAIVMTPFIDSWSAVNPASLASAKEAVETWLATFLWDPVLMSVLKLPNWLVLGVLSLLLFWVGQRPSARIGHFASH